VQTILGLLGFFVAGAEVKSIIKGSSLRRALGATWYMFIHGKIRAYENIGPDLKDGQPPPEDA
jgi:hypothetical protein